MPQYFYNKVPIDLAAIELLGVSVKSEGAIGFFGTGLKFALSVLLRSGCEVELLREGLSHKFSTRSVAIRDKEFQQVCLNGQPLGFTTNLGRNWEPWMAWRELHANALDEQGGSGPRLPPGEWGTVFQIEGEAIEVAARQRDEIFLPISRLPPVEVSTEIAVYPKQGTGSKMFYRTIRARDLESPGLYTYNVLQEAELTEDRTLKYEYFYTHALARAVQMSRDRDLIEAVVLAPEGVWERNLTFNSFWPVGALFLQVVGEHRRDHRLSESAYKVWVHKSPEEADAAEPEEQLSGFQEGVLGEALALLAVLGKPGKSRSDFKVVSGLGEGILGRFANGKVYLALGVFDQGPLMVAGTLWEEFLHQEEHLADEGRYMQNFLINKAVVLAQELRALRAGRDPERVPPSALRPVVLALPDYDDEIPF